MSIVAQFKELLQEQRSNDIIPFLQGLTQGERRELAPIVKRLYKEYTQIIQEGTVYRNKMNETEQTILSYAAFVCYNYNEYVNTNLTWFFSKEHLGKLLPWYCPSWFSEYINSFKERDWFPYQMDYLQPHPHVLARLLVNIIYENHDRKNYFVPGKLERLAITLNEHIWYLFQYETSIHIRSRYVYFEGKKADEEHSWIAVFQQYTEAGKIDRLRLLKEALLASNRNFNKLLSGWFAGLFQSLKPTVPELLALQPELSLLLSSPHSKVVNTAFQSIKLLIDEEVFDSSAFLDHAPLLLVSSTKSLVLSALQILEKLGKRLKDKKHSIALLAAQALVQKEESLQKKAAQLILEYGEANEDLRQAVMMNAPSLFASVKELLAIYLNELAPAEFHLPTGHTVTSHSNVLNKSLKLTPVADFDELIFLTSQAFDNNETWHFDLVLDALVRFQNKISGEDIYRLEPAFQRALKLLFGDRRSNTGQIDVFLAAFFLEFGQLLMRRHPGETSSLWKLYEGFFSKNEERRKLWIEYGNNLTFLGGINYIKEGEHYWPHKVLLEEVIQKLQKGEETPLLSTPTHAPCWIHPVALVQRLAYYLQNKNEYSATDLQIALSRCWLKDTGEALVLTEKLLTGEEKQLMNFLLDPQARPVGPFTTEWAWMIASLAKSPAEIFPELESLSYSKKPHVHYTGQYPWNTIVEEYLRDEYKYENEKFEIIKVPAKHKVLRLDCASHNQELQKEPLLYDHLRMKSRYYGLEDRDFQKILFLIPNNPGPLIAFVVNKSLKYAQFWDETDKRQVIQLLRGLYELGTKQEEIGHLFIATCMVSSDKTAASLAAEIWIKDVQDGTINSASIGRVIGIHQRIEFIPLKRLNDLLMTQLLNISSLHNKALEEMIASLIKHLPSKPVKHLKILLGIYFELVTLNGSVINDPGLDQQLKLFSPKLKKKQSA